MTATSSSQTSRAGASWDDYTPYRESANVDDEPLPARRRDPEPWRALFPRTAALGVPTHRLYRSVLIEVENMAPEALDLDVSPETLHTRMAALFDAVCAHTYSELTDFHVTEQLTLTYRDGAPHLVDAFTPDRASYAEWHRRVRRFPANPKRSRFHGAFVVNLLTDDPPRLVPHPDDELHTAPPARAPQCNESCKPAKPKKKKSRSKKKAKAPTATGST